MKPEISYFGIQAYVGTTKHLGGFETTTELIERCQINPHSVVLEVGCGVGATACYIAKKYNCRVTGVDALPSMIARAKERAAREGVESLVEFKVADACDLPFEDGYFDVVLCESVITFIEDKEKAAHELTRVLKPGGYTGLNEEYWIIPPPARIAADVKSIWDVQAEIPALDNWLEILGGAGLQDCMAIPYRFNTRREATQVKRYRLIDMWEMFSRSISLYIKYPDFRAYMKNHGRLPNRIFEYLGYALFIGNK